MVKRKKKSALTKKIEDPNSSYWKRKVDSAWGAIIHAAGGGCVCKILGDCKGPLEAHHLITRGRDATRHDPRNGVLLCSYHHKWSKKCSPHMAPLEFAEFLQRFRQDVWAQFLMMKDDTPMAEKSYKERREVLEKVYMELTKKELDR